MAKNKKLEMSNKRNKSIKLFNKSVVYNNKAKNLKEKQFAVEMFLKNVNKVGLYYSNYKK